MQIFGSIPSCEQGSGHSSNVQNVIVQWKQRLIYFGESKTIILTIALVQIHRIFPNLNDTEL